MAQPQPRITLFSSSVSQNSQQAENIIRQFIPVAKIVRLDTKAQREWAANGASFSVRQVPTLLIQHPNGQLEQRIGIDQIAALFRPPGGKAAKGRPRPGRSGRAADRSTGGSRPGGVNMYDDPEGWRHRAAGGAPDGDDDDAEGEDDDDYPDGPLEDPREPPGRGRPSRPAVVEESSDDDEVEVAPQKPVKKVRIQEPKKSGRSKGSSAARGRAEAERKLAAAKEVKGATGSQRRGKQEADKKLQGLAHKKKSGPKRMKSIMAEAKKQEADLKRALEE